MSTGATPTSPDLDSPDLDDTPGPQGTAEGPVNPFAAVLANLRAEDPGAGRRHLGSERGPRAHRPPGALPHPRSTSGGETPSQGAEDGTSDAGALADELLGSFGLDASRQAAVGACREALSARGHQGEIRSVRWGVVTVAVDALGAAALRLDADQVLAQVNAQLDAPPLRSLHVRVLP